MTSWRGYRLLDIMTKCGQRDDLKLCLDAGDSASYSGAGQSWLDQSGNGFDFFRGETSGAAADDPTFNGTAGNLTSSEYWSFDGGDLFQYDTTNETWMQNLHKDNAIFSGIFWTYFADLSTDHNTWFGTCSLNLTQTGIMFFENGGAGDNPSLRIHNGSGVAALDVSASGLAATLNTWECYGISVNEAAGTGFFFKNGSISTFTSTYSTPSAGNATATMQIGAANSNRRILNGGRMSQVAMWEGRSLSADELTAIYMATRGRFGV